jgi:hypothetical protein
MRVGCFSLRKLWEAIKNLYLGGLEESSITAGNKGDKSGIREFWWSEDSFLSDIINGRQCEKPTENIRKNQIKYTIKKWIIWIIMENMKRIRFKWMRNEFIYIIDLDG